MKNNIKNFSKAIQVPMELAISIIAFALIGYYLGKHFFGENASIIGLIMGAIIGFFSAIKYLTTLFRS